MKKKIYCAHTSGKLLRRIAAVGELAVFTGLFSLVCPKSMAAETKLLLLTVYAMAGGGLLASTDGFAFARLHRPDLLLAQGISLLLTNAAAWCLLSLLQGQLFPWIPMAVLLCGQLLLAAALVWGCTAALRRLYAPRGVLLIYGSDSAGSLQNKLNARRHQFRVQRRISAREGYDALCREIVNHDSVVINDVPAQLRNDLVKFCYQKQIPAYVVPKITDIILRGGQNITAFDVPMVLTGMPGLTASQRFWKRAMDITLSLLALLPALPVMGAVAAAIRLEDGGPVFYKQKRMTCDGREFEILKFRSMVVDAEKHGAVLAAKNDTRITRVGRLIRATRMDELPQLLNILKGDMSIVGPRPERKVIADAYARDIPEFGYRLRVRGGLTGYAQIYGKYNTQAYDKLRLDLMYIENYSLLLDIKLILMTLRILFSKESTEGVDAPKEEVVCS